MDAREIARSAVTSPSNLATFGERGFRTVINGRVLDYLVLTAGLDRQVALAAARDAVEELGGLVVGRRTTGGVTTPSFGSPWPREVWMIPETAVVQAGMTELGRRPRAA